MCWPHSTCRFCTFKEKFLISFWCAVCNGIFYTEKFLEKKKVVWTFIGRLWENGMVWDVIT